MILLVQLAIIKFYSEQMVADCFLTLFVYAINNAFVPWFLGEDYKAAARYTPLLMLSVVFTGYSGYYSSVFSLKCCFELNLSHLTDPAQVSLYLYPFFLQILMYILA